MSAQQVAFVDWIQQRSEAAEHLLRYELSDGPREFFLQGSSVPAGEFYQRVELWRKWLSALVTGLRHRVEHADHLVRDAERRFGMEQILTLRISTNDGEIKTFDLSNQAAYIMGDGWVEIRRWLERGREDPPWKAITDTLAREVRAFSAMVVEQAEELRFREIEVGASTPPPGIGSLRYECLTALGAGAYGEAWRAKDVELNREVVVKFIRSTGATRKDAVEAARALARVTDANIVVVHHVDEVADPVTGRVLDAVIMELVEGTTLLHRLGSTMSRSEALRIGQAILNAVSAYRANGLVHHDLHEGNVIVGDRTVKVIDPMYFETVAVRSVRAREELQEREVRCAARTLASILRVTDIDMDSVLDFERSTFRCDLATLRASYESVLATTPSPASASYVTAAALPQGFEPGPVGDIGRMLLAEMAQLGTGERQGYSGLLDLTTFARQRQLHQQQVRDAAELLDDGGFVTHERQNMVKLTLAGREEAHRLGEFSISPFADYLALVGFLAEYGEDEKRGATMVDETVLTPALGFNRFRLLDAGELLRTNGTGDMLVTMGGPVRVSLNARGRLLAATS